ncbi:MAG TPA: hypothetical protein VIJ62_02910 [Rhizomicrobium sp.]
MPENTHCIACQPAAIPEDKRAEHQQLLRAVTFGKVLSAEEMQNGFALTYRAEDFLDLAKWVALERLCCPFVEFTLQTNSAGVKLQLSGPEGTKEYLLSIMPQAAGI